MREEGRERDRERERQNLTFGDKELSVASDTKTLGHLRTGIRYLPSQ